MTAPELLTGQQPLVFFLTYIESSQMREWNYAFNLQIEAKEIQESYGKPMPHGTDVTDV
jgi:hypothetical protein